MTELPTRTLTRSGDATEAAEAARTADIAAMRAIQRGDRNAFREFFFRQKVSVYNYLLRGTRSRATAEDLTQETFTRVAKGVKTWEPKGTVRGWLFAIARNVLIDHARAVAARPRLLDVEVPDEPCPTIHPDLVLVLREALLACIYGLSEDHREVFVLFHVSGLTLTEIADACGIPLGTAKSRLASANKNVRSGLIEKGIRPEL